jgi:O-antigen ligase
MVHRVAMNTHVLADTDSAPPRSRLRAARLTAMWGMFVLFPGFFLYHYAISQEWIPEFAGGLFGAAAAVVTTICLVLLPWIVTRPARGGFLAPAMIVVTLAYLAVWTLVNYLLAPDAVVASSAFRESAEMLVMWVAMVFVGVFYSFRQQRATMVLRWLAMALLFCIVHAFAHYESVIGPYLAFRGNTELMPDGGSKYQGAGRSVLVTVIVLSAVLRGAWWRVLLLLSGIAAILAIGARAELFSLVLVAVLAVGVALVKERNVLLVFVVATILVAASDTLTPILADNRAAEIIDLGSSSSWQGRQVLTAEAIAVIGRHPLTGDHTYRYRALSEGGYSHNALSAWTSYGLIGFVLYVGLVLGFTCLSMLRVLRQGEPTPEWSASLYLNSVAALLAISAVPVFHPLAALGWGVTLNALSQDRASISIPAVPAQRNL